MIKLMPKKLVNAVVATQRKEEIDRGIKLAEKIDAVRETLAKEEKRLEEFRRESVLTVQMDIDSKLRQKNEVESQILVARANLRELREPLDGEWEMVKKSKDVLSSERESLYEKKGELERGIALNIQRERMNEVEENRLVDLRKQIEAENETAEKARNEAIKHLLDARSQASLILSEAQEREEAVEVREDAIEAKEIKNKDQKQKQDKREKELNDKDREIKDRYETLLRTENRYGRPN